MLILPLFALAGCGGVKDLGLGALPVYDVPSAALDGEDKIRLERWRNESPSTFKKIQGIALSYKAIIDAHNSWALHKNKERLEMMGFKDEDLKKLISTTH